MTRNLFGGTSDDQVVRRVGLFLAPVPGVTVTFWNAQVGGSQYTDLQDAGGSAITSVTSDADGYLPPFYGPDAVTSMWVESGGSTRRRMLTQGLQGPAGAAGSSGSDAAVAGYLANSASATRAALTRTGAKPVGQGEIVFNVKDYGAVGDGTADDTTAITNAIAAVTAAIGGGVLTGGTVFFPRGRYKITSTLIVPVAIKLVGISTSASYEDPSNAPGSVLQAATSGMTMLKVDPGGSLVAQSGPGFEGLTFTDKTSGTATLLSIRLTNRVRIAHCNFMGAAVGIKMDADNPAVAGGDCSWHYLTGNHFFDCDRGIHDAGGGSSGVVHGGSFHSCAVAAIDVAGRSAGWRISNVKFDVNVAGAYGVRTKGYQNHIVVCDFEMTNGATGVQLAGDSAIYPSPPSGSGSQVALCGFVGHTPATDVGIDITSDSRDAVVIGNRFSNLTDVNDAGNNTARFGATGSVYNVGTAAAVQTYKFAGSSKFRTVSGSTYLEDDCTPGGATMQRIVTLGGTASSAKFILRDSAGTTLLEQQGNGWLLLKGVVWHQGTQVGFYNATPVSRPAAYTQTYATTSRVHAAYTADVESTAYTGATDGEAKLTDLNALRIAYENLRVAHESTSAVLNRVIDDLQAVGLLQ